MNGIHENLTGYQVLFVNQITGCIITTSRKALTDWFSLARLRSILLYIQKRQFCFPVAQTVKNLPTMQETLIPSLGQEDPLEKEMATPSSILAWRIPWTEEPDRL